MKILIVFGSLLGKTKRVSVLLGHILRQDGFDVTVKAVQNTRVNEITNYDLVILGCSTWDDGQLQFDFRPFNDELLDKKYSNKKFAIFGLGGHKYPHFCESVNILEATIKRIKGTLIVPSLRLDIDHDEPADKSDTEIVEWAKGLSSTPSVMI